MKMLPQIKTASGCFHPPLFASSLLDDAPFGGVAGLARKSFAKIQPVQTLSHAQPLFRLGLDQLVKFRFRVSRFTAACQRHSLASRLSSPAPKALLERLCNALLDHRSMALTKPRQSGPVRR